MEKVQKKNNLSVTLTRIVFILLVIAAVYSLIGIVMTIIHKTAGHFLGRPRSEYIKIFLQSLLGLAVIYLPELLKKRLGMTFTDGMQIIYVTFLYGAIILGETLNFYRRFPGWDTILHTLSGVMLGAFGFSLVHILNDNKAIDMQLGPRFVAVFSFCIAVTLGCFWELLEWVMDLLMNLDMQQYITYDGVVLVGKAAVFDTMKDLLVDVLGAAVMSIIGFFMIKKHGLIGRMQKQGESE
jgi:uncharacterized membrane protein YjdF